MTVVSSVMVYVLLFTVNVVGDGQYVVNEVTILLVRCIKVEVTDMIESDDVMTLVVPLLYDDVAELDVAEPDVEKIDCELEEITSLDIEGILELERMVLPDINELDVKVVGITGREEAEVTERMTLEEETLLLNTTEVDD